ncbi:TetR/AcrR family transcriptional regulator [uncultured Parasphingorhabdus sp.]|uniref:TetR/AcrR family transcriptional regulator n=1 Tax=uncultured Parasphingorhabdus sp. TaxID=2709694 RepID=UPI002AA8D4B2|nr:TetR/AcrR family transcriptional regulator [uncultured Parasphingorhabdus sp.]
MAVKKRRTQAERREEAETRLLVETIKLVGECGYDGFTLADVAEAAGYSRGLPAHYFGSKEGLLARVVEYVTQDYHDSIAKNPEILHGLPALENLVHTYVRVNGAPIRTFQILTAQALVRSGLKMTMSRLTNQSLKSIEKEIRAGIELGNIRKDIDVSAHAAMIYSFLRGQLAFAAFDRDFDQEAAGKEFIETMRARLGLGN